MKQLQRHIDDNHDYSPEERKAFLAKQTRAPLGTNPEERKAFLAKQTRNEKVRLLIDLIAWADSEEGCEFRADLAAMNQPSPFTAEDVLSLLDARATALVYDAIPELTREPVEPTGADAMPADWSEEKKEEVFDSLMQMAGDMSTKEIAHDLCKDWTAEDWKEHSEYLTGEDEE